MSAKTEIYPKVRNELFLYTLKYNKDMAIFVTTNIMQRLISGFCFYMRVPTLRSILLGFHRSGHGQ
jgi:hypothetical protein